MGEGTVDTTMFTLFWLHYSSALEPLHCLHQHCAYYPLPSHCLQHCTLSIIMYYIWASYWYFMSTITLSF
jgi:hypothetical protein